jgi:3-oxoacyl-[acyl-carrier protein] reductase
METLQRKLAVVTGGTRGIGRAISERLLREGAAVAICGRSAESVEKAVAGMAPLGSVHGRPVDIRNVEAVREFFVWVDEKLGGVDILVNNAGEAVFGKVAELQAEDWLRNIDLNLNAAYFCSHEALSRFARRGGGFIVNISSLAGKNAFSGGAAYNASKYGLNGFTEALMLDHRYDNVRVTCIMPGSVNTDFGTSAGRPGTGGTDWMIAPEDVAEVVATVLRMPARTMVSRVEMRPSQPKK